jgi:hypothetical protein
MHIMYKLLTVSLALSTNAHPFITAKDLPRESAWMTILQPTSSAVPVAPSVTASSIPVGQPPGMPSDKNILAPPAPTTLTSATVPTSLVAPGVSSSGTATISATLSTTTTPGVTLTTTQTIPAVPFSSAVPAVPAPSSSALPPPSSDTGGAPTLHIQVCSTENKCEDVTVLPHTCQLLTTPL